MADDEGSISVEKRNHVLLIGFNRPEKYNGYTPKNGKGVNGCNHSPR